MCCWPTARDTLGSGCWRQPHFLVPLLIDLYIPLRWPALHNGHWMSFGDFIAWITGQQFRGAMQFGLWRDPTRWRIVGGLMLDTFGPVGAALAAIGLAWLIARRWRIALVTFIAGPAILPTALSTTSPMSLSLSSRRTF